MPAILTPLVESETVAAVAARRNWVASRAAVAARQPAVAAALDDVEPDVEWTLGRDGSLTGRTADGRWWADCSVPDRAGRRLMAAVERADAVHCLLVPEHAGILLAVRDRLGAGTPVIVVQPDARAARVLLGCEDVADAVSSGRLWLAVGVGWADQLADLFRAYPGLATPSRFVRTPLAADADVLPLIERAQAVFAAAAEARNATLCRVRAGWADKPATRGAVVICRSAYTLWEGGPAMLGATCGPAAVRFDTDDPLNTSPVALATVAAACGGVVAADRGREGGTGLVRPDVPWITLMTRPIVPEVTAREARDAVVVPEASWRVLAVEAGWPANRVHVSQWPPVRLPPSNGRPHLAVMVDTRPIGVPTAVAEYSSHAMLWEAIEAELRTSPLAAWDAAAYLTDRAGQVRVGLHTLDVQTFLDRLIYPAYQQGIARLLIAAGLPVRLWGTGWADLDEFAGRSAGTVESLAGRDRAAGAAVGLVHCWPDGQPHPIHAMGRPVLRVDGEDAGRVVAQGRQILRGEGHVRSQTGGEPFWDVVRRVLSV